jgi:CHAD domain-containing protein
MKTSKSYLKYFKKIEKNIVCSLKISSEKFVKEDYHKLRVEIKKLNALLISLEFCLKSFKKNKYFKPLKNLFKQAGKIRNYQLEESTLKRNDAEHIAQYLSHLEQTIEQEKIKFASLYDKMNVEKIKKRLKKIEPFIKKISIKDLHQFVESERNKIRHFFRREPLLAANLHSMRKLLKIDFYTRKITDRPIAENLVEEENSFLELLGKWHDCRTINDLLEKNILKGAPATNESGHLLKINREIKSTSEDLLKNIKQRVDRGVYL